MLRTLPVSDRTDAEGEVHSGQEHEAGGKAPFMRWLSRSVSGVASDDECGMIAQRTGSLSLSLVAMFEFFERL